MKGEPVMLEIYHPDGKKAQIGTWLMPGELIDNYSNQKDIGWHIFCALVNGAERVEVVRGQPNPNAST